MQIYSEDYGSRSMRSQRSRASEVSGGVDVDGRYLDDEVQEQVSALDAPSLLEQDSIADEVPHQPLSPRSNFRSVNICDMTFEILKRQLPDTHDSADC